MKISDWRLYNHALILNTPPHVSSEVDIRDVKNSLREKKAYFARWTSGYDKYPKSEWWYCIKDSPIILSELTSKQRYRINKGLKNILVSQIKKDNVKDYLGEISEIAEKCFANYPSQYRPNMYDVMSEYKRMLLDEGANGALWGCKDRETGKFCGFSICIENDNWINLAVVKVLSEYQKKEINAALVYSICEHYLKQSDILYISDGERNIRHQTAYQDYLVRVLGFKYVYCKLNVVYNTWIVPFIKILYPFRSIIKHLSHGSSYLYNLYCVLKQEEIVRSFFIK